MVCTSHMRENLGPPRNLPQNRTEFVHRRNLQLYRNTIRKTDPQLICHRRTRLNFHLAKGNFIFLPFNPQPPGQRFRIDIPFPAERRLSQPE